MMQTNNVKTSTSKNWRMLYRAQYKTDIHTITTVQIKMNADKHKEVRVANIQTLQLKTTRVQTNTGAFVYMPITDDCTDKH